MQDLNAVFRHQCQILDPHTEAARQVDTRFR